VDILGNGGWSARGKLLDQLFIEVGRIFYLWRMPFAREFQMPCTWDEFGCLFAQHVVVTDLGFTSAGAISLPIALVSALPSINDVGTSGSTDSPAQA
jgi:hypothetical protein